MWLQNTAKRPLQVTQEAGGFNSHGEFRNFLLVRKNRRNLAKLKCEVSIKHKVFRKPV